MAPVPLFTGSPMAPVRYNYEPLHGVLKLLHEPEILARPSMSIARTVRTPSEEYRCEAKLCYLCVLPPSDEIGIFFLKTNRRCLAFMIIELPTELRGMQSCTAAA